MHFIFAFFITNSYYYLNLIWVCDLSVQVNSTCLALMYRNCPLTFKLKSYFAFLQKLLTSDHWTRSVWTDFLEGFAGFLGGHRCFSLFLMKLRAWGFAALLKGDYKMGVFPMGFVKLFFLWESANEIFWFPKFWHITRLVFIFSCFCDLYLFKLCYQSNFL